jgi:LysM repeat protein
VAHEGWRRYLAPAAFLAAVTVAAILVHAGLRSGTSGGGATRSAVTTPGTGGTAARRSHGRYWRVRAGDTFASIAARTGVPVARLRRLNPTVKSTSLHIGERIRLR